MTTATPTVSPYTHAARRARTLAEVALDRYTTDPGIRDALVRIALHLDGAAYALEAVTPGADESSYTDATEELFHAEQIAVENPAARLPAELSSYVLAPLVDRALPLPAPLHPKSPDFADFTRREADLAHALHLLHSDHEHQAQRTDDWLRQVCKVWQQHTRLADEVRADNARAHRHP
ncbi:hypothetical protein [Streptomyces longispororuber]|uniref:hypothetical protein n=1 Tax=Streptomyces longispororuber TaxID=68230 RepID=UPI0036FB1E37